MNRILGVLLVLGVCAAGALYAGSPLLTFQQLKRAAEAGDRDQLQALVDFPAVRENLKQQVDSKAVKLAREASGVGVLPVMALGKLGSMLGDRAIDRLVTPEAVAAIVNSGRNPRLHWKRRDSADAESPDAAVQDAKPVVNYAYQTPDRFRVALSPPDRPDTSAALILERHGLFSWRVEEIELPK